MAAPSQSDRDYMLVIGRRRIIDSATLEVLVRFPAPIQVGQYFFVYSVSKLLEPSRQTLGENDQPLLFVFQDYDSVHLPFDQEVGRYDRHCRDTSYVFVQILIRGFSSNFYVQLLSRGTTEWFLQILWRRCHAQVRVLLEPGDPGRRVIWCSHKSKSILRFVGIGHKRPTDEA